MKKNKSLVLLTGGRGMVGRNILEHPLAQNFSFIAPTSAELNLCNYKQVSNFITKVAPDYVIHAAGKVGGIQANLSSPVDYLTENIDMGRNVLIASRNANIKKLINLASSCIYPHNAKNPLTEDLILKGELEPTNEGYALAKIFTLRLGQYINRENPEFQYKTLIPCNIYGKYDKYDLKNSHLIAAIINKMHIAKINSSKTVEIWGQGNARRETMYAADLADSILSFLKDFDRTPFIMNIGQGFDHTISDYYKIIASVVGWNGKFIYNLTKPEGMRQKLVSITEQESWGWKPKTNLLEGIQKTYEFYLEQSK